MYLENYGRGYASGIARTFGCALYSIQKQLVKFEETGLLVSRREGTSRMYYFKKGPVADSLRRFLGTMLDMLPEATRQRYYRQRRRPRRFGKLIALRHRRMMGSSQDVHPSGNRHSRTMPPGGGIYGSSQLISLMVSIVVVSLVEQ